MMLKTRRKPACAAPLCLSPDGQHSPVTVASLRILAYAPERDAAERDHDKAGNMRENSTVRRRGTPHPLGNTVPPLCGSQELSGREPAERGHNNAGNTQEYSIVRHRSSCNPFGNTAPLLLRFSGILGAGARGAGSQ